MEIDIIRAFIFIAIGGIAAVVEYATWPSAEEIARRKLSNDLRRIRGSR